VAGENRARHLTAEADPHDEESPLYWGNVLEPIVAWHYSKRSQHKVRRINAVLQHPDPQLPWMLANIDREVIGADDVQILECKTAGINGARLWKEGVPEYVQLQVMHQLAVTGKQAADVAVLLGGQHLEIHRIERDEALIARLIDLERLFWDYVVSDTPPPADGTASAEAALRCLYPEDNGQTLDFSQHTELTSTFLELKAVRQNIAQQETREAQLKQVLQQAMGKPPVQSLPRATSAGRSPRTALVWMSNRCSRTNPTCRPATPRPKQAAVAS
jgi:putative phage-type endonuclease